MGGEEFVMLLPSTDRDGAIAAAEKIRAAVAAITVPGIEREITISIGIALIPDHAGDAEGSCAKPTARCMPPRRAVAIA